jgi:hypothetical protein
VDNVEELIISVLANGNDFKCAGANKKKSHGAQSFANLHYSCAIISNCLSAVGIHHQQVPAIGSQSRLDGSLYGQTSINIGYGLTLAL